MRIMDAITPGFLAEYLAERFRNKSKDIVSQTDPQKLTLSTSALGKQFSRGFDFIVCGHVHHEEIRDMESGKKLVVLPSWNGKGGGYAVWENGKMSILPWPAINHVG